MKLLQTEGPWDLCCFFVTSIVITGTQKKIMIKYF